jgi:hypothetical protein
MPDVNGISHEEKTKKYERFIERISIINNILQTSKKDVKLYFFRKDLILLNKNKKLFTKEKLNELKQLKMNNKYNSQLDNLYNFYIELIDNLLTKGYDNISNRIYSKYITIESHLDMKINDINIENTPIYEHDIESLSYDTSFLKLFKKKMVYLAFLNHYIYLNSGINKILNHPEIPNDEIKITAKINEVTHQFLIDEIPKIPFTIDRQKIDFCKLDNIIRRGQFDTIEQAYLQAKKDFSETLVFNNNVNENIENYHKSMLILLKNMPNNSKILKHKKECPYTLYDHLDSLDRLVKYFRSTKPIPINKRRPILNKFIKKHNDKGTCYLDNEIVCKRCSAFLRLCRYDCSGETATKERCIDGKLYQIHLKPYEYGINGINKDIADLTLRIYFRWDNDKIQVGYIGKHLP